MLIDGEAHLACLTLAETVAGRSVETPDGLKTGPDLHPLQTAFMENFAAQCGYCTPGMLMAAKALLDRNPSPSPQRGRRGDLRQHLPLHRLRTHHQGHSRRRRGRRRAARLKGSAMLELRKDIFADERDDNLKEIGKPTQRQDMLGHVTATSTYFNDHKLQGMLHLKVLRSPHSHARIRRIDVSEAERLPGVARIIRGADVPRNLNTLLSLINFGKDDEPTLAVDKVRYKGEPIVAVVADSHREAFEALAKIRVDYEPLAAVFDVEDALKPGAPVVNETYPNNTFTLSRPLRPSEAALRRRRARLRAKPTTCSSSATRCRRSSTRRPKPTAPSRRPTPTGATSSTPRRRRCSSRSTPAPKILDVPSNKLHFIGGTVGGGFGGKVDTLTEPLAILGAMLTGRPVRYIFGREEEMQYGPPRGAERIYRQGRRQSRRSHRRAQGARLFRQRRLYAAFELRRRSNARRICPAPTRSRTCYADVYCVFTNRVPSTAMRGFGVTAVDFAIECQMDKLADLVGMDPMEFRILNAYRDGDMKAHRREAKNTALIECVQVAAEKAKWPIRDEFKRARRARTAAVSAPRSRLRARDASPAARPAAQQRTTYERAPTAAPTPEPARPPRRPPPRRRPLPRRDAVLVGVRHKEALTWPSIADAAWPRSTIPSA